MSKYLIDSDAWLALRKLSVLDLMITATTLPRPLLMCEYAARHELSSIFGELSNLERQTYLSICSVHAKEKKLQIRSLIREGTDKGEAEAVVWSLAQDNDCRPCFVSVDRGARRIAREKGLVAGDVFDLIVDLLGRRILDIAEVQVRYLRQSRRPENVDRSKFTERKAFVWMSIKV